MNFYKVLEPTFLNNAMRQPGEVVRFNDDPDNGGMRPGKTLVACDEDGNEVKRTKKRTTKADDIG